MVKNIVIGVLVLLCLVLFVYARVQQTEATRQAQLAYENEKIAISMKEMAQKQSELARMNAEEARRQQQLAEAALRDCMKKKK